MNPVSILRAAAEEVFRDFDGRVLPLTLKPGLDAAALERFSARLGLPLPLEIRELLSYAQGFDFPPVDRVDFCGREVFEFRSVFPRGIVLAGDGFGNSWVVDVDPVMGGWGPVFFASHDPPVVVLQSPNLGLFLQELFNLGRPGRPSALERVRGEASASVWRERSGAIQRTEAARSDDADLAAFAVSLPEHAEIYDLRQFAEGLGFALGNTGKCIRHASLRLFALENKPPRKSFWLRLFPG